MVRLLDRADEDLADEDAELRVDEERILDEAGAREAEVFERGLLERSPLLLDRVLLYFATEEEDLLTADELFEEDDLEVFDDRVELYLLTEVGLLDADELEDNPREFLAEEELREADERDNSRLWYFLTVLLSFEGERDLEEALELLVEERLWLFNRDGTRFCVRAELERLD